MSLVVRPGDHLFMPIAENMSKYEIDNGERWLTDEMPGVKVSLIQGLMTCGPFVYRRSLDRDEIR